MSTLPHSLHIGASHARTLTDDKLLEYTHYVALHPLLSASGVDDRRAVADLLEELDRRYQARRRTAEIGCGADQCRYPDVVGLAPGVDVSIDGDIWPGSPYARHLAYCPSRVKR